MNTSLLLKLIEIEAVKFGQFKLKSGQTSPIYIDLRVTVSYPDILKEIGEALWIKVSHLSFDLLCGVPYTALPFATALSLMHQKPMLMRRKEAKEYGTKKLIEGVFKPGQTCLVIEDLITTGMSIFETIEPLQNEGLQIRDVAVLLDREQGGRQKLSGKGYRLHSVFSMTELLEALSSQGVLDIASLNNVKQYIAKHQAG